MSAVVLDASVALAALLPDEKHPFALGVIASLDHNMAYVPPIWWFETRNILLVSQRRGRLPEAGLATALSLLRRLPVIVDQASEEAGILELARRYRLSVYDAAYLELARRRQAMLATLDDALEEAARGEKLAVFPV